MSLLAANSWTRLTIRDATSSTAVFVGAQASVRRLEISIAQSREPIVLVFPVPGGPHISLTEEENFPVTGIQSATAFSCDMLSMKFSRPRSSIDRSGKHQDDWELFDVSHFTAFIKIHQQVSHQEIAFTNDKRTFFVRYDYQFVQSSTRFN
jgi:hypothetical protein